MSVDDERAWALRRAADRLREVASETADIVDRWIAAGPQVSAPRAVGYRWSRMTPLEKAQACESIAAKVAAEHGHKQDCDCSPCVDDYSAGLRALGWTP